MSNNLNTQALDLLRHGAILLDMRTREEYCQGHFKGALLVVTPPPPLNQREMLILKDQLWWLLSTHTVNKYTHIVIYCRKGFRTKIAKQVIQELGYRNVLAWGGVEEPHLRKIFANQALICHHDPIS
uniref:Rhodanese domain-containing protein n=1 Tax=viral metagenome TaxID=1070528 RepID=A0A6C0BKW7_9ZZZZ